MQITPKILKKIFGKREKWAHKGQFGKLGIVAGNKIYTGSPILVGMAAYRAGCDLVYLITPKRAADVAASYSPCLITFPLKNDFLSVKDVDSILKFLKERRIGSLVIGNGLGRKIETKQAILELIRKVDLPLILDADALRALPLDLEVLEGKRAILLPHANEFFELTGIKVENDVEDRRKKVEKWLKKVKEKVDGEIIVVLKGYIDVVSNGEKTYLNESGCNLMTKGGFGDTLAGICGALVARKVELFLAACVATWLNGKAGELIAKKFGESMLPTDLIENLHLIIKRFSAKSGK
jgi:NAD(P)H-hydrate epimerase